MECDRSQPASVRRLQTHLSSRGVDSDHRQRSVEGAKLYTDVVIRWRGTGLCVRVCVCVQYFVSSGFAFVHADSTAEVCAVEAVPLEHLDGAAVKEVRVPLTPLFLPPPKHHLEQR